MQNKLSRRKFIEKSSLGLGAGMIGLSRSKGQILPLPRNQRLPREVWIGSISMQGLDARTPSDKVDRVLRIMESMIPYQPDIICLPECFAYGSINDPAKLRKVAEAAPGVFTRPFEQFAHDHTCYVICPTYTRKGDNIYIAAVLINRKGKVVGEYRKIRPAISEIEAGVRPGPIKPPVFETDFGKIGIQICFDIKWDAGWQALAAGGAEIIFWPSAYGGGQELRSRAWKHQTYVVSSTAKGRTRICDMTGEVIAKTNHWQANWTCAAVNLEKAFLHTWPAVHRFGKIREKYGRKIKLTTFAEEEWSLIESLHPEVKVADILAEFNLPTHRQVVEETAALQDKFR